MKNYSFYKIVNSTNFKLKLFHPECQMVLEYIVLNIYLLNNVEFFSNGLIKLHNFAKFNKWNESFVIYSKFKFLKF